MAALTYNDGLGCFVWTGTPKEVKAPIDAGLCHTTVRKDPRKVQYFTATIGGAPEYNPYAVMSMWGIADEAARAKLDPLLGSYRDSFAVDADYDPARPSYAPEPYRFQRAGVKWGMDRDRVLIGDVMGLGKGPQATMIAGTMGAKRILVICPRAITVQWRRVLETWLLPLGRKIDPIFIVKNGKSGIHPRARVVIISYDMCKSPHLHAQLAAQDWDCIIIDEAHYLKNSGAARTRHILGS